MCYYYSRPFFYRGVTFKLSRLSIEKMSSMPVECPTGSASDYFERPSNIQGEQMNTATTTKHARDWYKLSDRTRIRQIKEAVSLIKGLGGQIKPYEECPSWQNHVPHIKMHRGILYVNLEKVHLGDLIHEFAHLWVVPDTLKSEMSGLLPPYENGEEMAQAASYAIAYTLDIDPWIVLSVVTLSWKYLEDMLKVNEHPGIQFLIDNGLIAPNQFPNIFVSFPNCQFG